MMWLELEEELEAGVDEEILATAGVEQGVGPPPGAPLRSRLNSDLY